MINKNETHKECKQLVTRKLKELGYDVTPHARKNYHLIAVKNGKEITIRVAGAWNNGSNWNLLNKSADGFMFLILVNLNSGVDVQYYILTFEEADKAFEPTRNSEPNNRPWVNPMNENIHEYRDAWNKLSSAG